VKEARRIVESAINEAIDIVDNKLHALRLKNEREFSESANRIVLVAKMIVDVKLSLEQNVEIMGSAEPDLFSRHEFKG